MKSTRSFSKILRENLKAARQRWDILDKETIELLQVFTARFSLRISAGDLVLIQKGWYVTHSGLLRLARRRRCKGIEVEPVLEFCVPGAQRFAFKATVHTSSSTAGFAGYGDADPSNVPPLVYGAELRIAETRAVNRALRKAYGIGICSVEEIGSVERRIESERPVRKLAPLSSNGKNGHAANGNGTRVRDRLCQLIRQHDLDAELVKSYAVDFCGTKTLREASREQVENFVAQLADSAAKDRDSLLCQLNRYAPQKEGAA